MTSKEERLESGSGGGDGSGSGGSSGVVCNGDADAADRWLAQGEQAVKVG